MRLVACKDCHAQYDVTHVAAKDFPCRCGTRVENRELTAVDAEVHRCGSCGAIVKGQAESCTFCGSQIVREHGPLSLICPECFARNADESRFCTACGIIFRPAPIQVDGEELPCPACGVLMPSHAVGGVAVNECPACHGLWAPGESFGVLVQRATEARGERSESEEPVAPRVDGANPLSQGITYRSCPVCDVHMNRRNYGRSSGIIVDLCTAHGTWLDADELEQIAGYILSGRAERKAFVHHEHEDATGIEPGSDRHRNAVANAAFHQLLAKNRAGAYARPEDQPGGGWGGTILKLLGTLLR